ncbi:hypothetical protein AB0M02_03875 [Actinoplanes sp. NPDC051861]|uniref:alpha/beta hydrolase family protein n=1 Tax=Actinoplanes sp. NPDC051861 TaxID=3155170 RepID=UPI00343DA407
MAILTAGLTATAALSVPAVANAAPDTIPDLVVPAPTGPHRVGVTELHLIDRKRADLWVPERRRELMVSVWYPAGGGQGGEDPYVSAEESRLILERSRIEGVPTDLLSRVRTNARTGVPALKRPHGWPVVLLSPGFSYPRSSLTALGEDLASRGYVVAGVDHTYEAAAVTFPDGRIAECTVCDLLDQDLVQGSQVTAGRAADLSFVLDELSRRGVRGARVDAGRVAVAGHSIGGAAAAAAMQRDRRFDAGINLDGTFHPAVTGLSRPFLMVGNGNDHGAPGTDDSWDTTWQNLTGWRRWVTVSGTEHASFCDYAVFGQQAGIPVQPLPGDRVVEITRAYVAAFADLHLRHERTRLFDGPSPHYPEITFHP